MQGLANVAKELTERQHGVNLHNVQEPYVVNEVEGLLNLGSIQRLVRYTLSVVRDGRSLKQILMRHACDKSKGVLLTKTSPSATVSSLVYISG